MAFVVALPTSSSTSSLAVGRAQPFPPHSGARSAFFGASSSLVRGSRQDARVGRWALARTRIAQRREFDVRVSASTSAAPELQTAAFILAGAADLSALVALRWAVCSGQPVANAAAAADKTEPAAASDVELEPAAEASGEGLSAWLSRVRSSVREIRASAASRPRPLFVATPQQASLLVVLSALALGIAGLLLSSPVLWSTGYRPFTFAIDLIFMGAVVLAQWSFFPRTSAFGGAVDAAMSILAAVLATAIHTAFDYSVDVVLHMMKLWAENSGVPTDTAAFFLAYFALATILSLPELALTLAALLACYPFRGEIAAPRD